MYLIVNASKYKFSYVTFIIFAAIKTAKCLYIFCNTKLWITRDNVIGEECLQQLF